MAAESIATLKQQIDENFDEVLRMIKQNPAYRKLRDELLDKLADLKSKADTTFLQSSEFRDVLLETKQNIDSLSSVTELLKILRSHKATKAARSTEDAILSEPEGSVAVDEQAATTTLLKMARESQPSCSNNQIRRRNEMRPEEASDRDIEKLEIYLSEVYEEIQQLETCDVSLDEMDDKYCRLSKLRQVGSKWSRWLDKAKAHRSSQLAQVAAVTTLPTSTSNSASNSNTVFKANGTNTHSNGTANAQLDSKAAVSVSLVGQIETNGSELAQTSTESGPQLARREVSITRAIEKPIRFSEIEHNRAERKFREYTDQKARDQQHKQEITGLAGEQKERFRRVLIWFNKYMRLSGVTNERLPFEAPDFELTLERFMKVAKSQLDDVKNSSSLGAGACAMADVEVHSDKTGNSTKAVPGWLFEEASIFFTRARNAIVQRRRRDNISRLRTYWEHDETSRDDPALHDPELEAKLNANSLERDLAVEKLMDSFAQRENDPLFKVNDSRTDVAVSSKSQAADETPRVNDTLQSDLKNALNETGTAPDPERLVEDMGVKEEQSVAVVGNHNTETESDVEIVEPKNSSVQPETDSAPETAEKCDSAPQYSTDSDDDDFATVKVSSQTVRVNLGLNPSSRKTKLSMLLSQMANAKRARISDTSVNENPVVIKDDDDAISDRPASTSYNGAPLPTSFEGIEKECAIVISDDDD